ncbi:MAG: hypothetical protein Q8S19_04085 [Bacillota bacterium]|nr:hypothetical protein [Bacillota bacterium]
MKKAVIVVLIALFIGGGGWYFGTQQSHAKILPEHVAFWAELTRDCGEDIAYFTNYNGLAAYQGDMVSLIEAGLQSTNPVVRWLAAYEIIEYTSTPYSHRLRAAVASLNDDPVEEVKQAGRLAMSFIDGNYKYHSRVKAAVDNSFYIYYRYHGAQYNDGQVWIVKNDKVSVLQEIPGSIYNLHLAFDSNLIAVNYGGRTWGALSLIDVAEGTVTDVLPWEFLESQGVQFYSRNPRPAPYIVFREWNQDSSQMLLYYAYHTPDYERMYGHAVYDVATGKVLRATMPMLQTDVIFLDKAALDWK